MSGDLLFREVLVVVPTAFIAKILELAHEAHPGITITKQRACDTYWRPRMNRHIETVVRSCGVRQALDKSKKACYLPIHPLAFPSAP